MIYLLIALYLLGLIPSVIAVEFFFEGEKIKTWLKNLLIKFWPITAAVIIVIIAWSYIPKPANSIKYE